MGIESRREFLTKCGAGLAGIIAAGKAPAIIVKSMLGTRTADSSDGSVVPEPLHWGLCFTAKEPNVVVNMEKIGSSPAVTLETSFDGETWTPFDADGGTTPITLQTKGSRVYFRAGSGGNKQISQGAENTNYRHFTLTGRCAASGNVMSLLNGNSAIDSINSSMAFANLFRNCASLTSAPDMPATKVSSYCYRRMFQGCTSLVSAPSVIPIITMQDGCCSFMFGGCTSLIHAPSLPSMALYNNCYNSMFSGCSSLVSAPELPATTAKYYCYSSMFYGCSSLTSAPELPATKLDTSCYMSMFQNCTSLKNPPSLGATVVANSCYRNMFNGCTSLVKAPRLLATTLANECYWGMFISCRKVTEIEVAFTEWLSGATDYWVQNVASKGIFRCPTALGTNGTITRGQHKCPAGWTVENIG